MRWTVLGVALAACLWVERQRSPEVEKPRTRPAVPAVAPAVTAAAPSIIQRAVEDRGTFDTLPVAPVALDFAVDLRRAVLASADDEDRIRGLRALARIPDPRNREFFESVLASDLPERVRFEAALLLGHGDGPTQAVPR